MLKKSLIRTMAIFLAGLFSGSAFSAETMTVKIGHVASLTGPIAHLGKDNENGAKMAIEELNAKKIMINAKKVTFVLMSEDDAGDPKQGTSTAQKLVDAKINGIVGHNTSGASIPASKIYHRAGIPQIAYSVTSTGYNTQGYKSTFRVVVDDGKLGNALGRYAIDTLHAKKIAVIDDRTAYGQGIADQFVKGVKSYSPNVKIVQRQFTNDKATDFNAILTAHKPRNRTLFSLVDWMPLLAPCCVK